MEDGRSSFEGIKSVNQQHAMMLSKRKAHKFINGKKEESPTVESRRERERERERE